MSDQPPIKHLTTCICTDPSCGFIQPFYPHRPTCIGCGGELKPIMELAESRDTKVMEADQLSHEWEERDPERFRCLGCGAEWDQGDHEGYGPPAGACPPVPLMHTCRRCREQTELSSCPNCKHRADLPISECDCMTCQVLAGMAGGWLDALSRHEEAMATMTEPMNHLAYERMARVSQAVPSLSEQLPLETYHALYSVCARIATTSAADFTDDNAAQRRLVHYLIRHLMLGFSIGHEVVSEHGSLKGDSNGNDR